MFNFNTKRRRVSVLLTTSFSCFFLFTNLTSVAQERQANWDVVKTSISSVVVHAVALNNAAPGVKLSVAQADGKFLVSWSGLQEPAISHYQLEFSDNGKDFRHAALFFTGDEEPASLVYRFSEKIRGKAKLHCRLKAIDSLGATVGIWETRL